MEKYRQSFLIRLTSIVVNCCFIYQIINPFSAFGGNENAPDYGYSGNPNDTELVDPFTGDFNYNIPLFEMEGYPINLSYNSNVGMHTEASWVGLGWTLNPGSVNRNMQGIPDDFKNDTLIHGINLKKEEYGGMRSGSGKNWGLWSNESGIGIHESNYKNSIGKESYTKKSETRIKSIQVLGYGNTRTKTYSYAKFNNSYTGISETYSLTLSHTKQTLKNWISPFNLFFTKSTTNSLTTSTSYNSRGGVTRSLSGNSSVSNGFMIGVLPLDLGINKFNYKTHSNGQGYSFNNNSVNLLPTLNNVIFVEGGSFKYSDKKNLVKSNHMEVFGNERSTFNLLNIANGYLWQNGNGNTEEVIREVDNLIIEETPILPIPKVTKDQFHVYSGIAYGTFQGQNLKGQYTTKPNNYSNENSKTSSFYNKLTKTIFSIGENSGSSNTEKLKSKINQNGTPSEFNFQRMGVMTQTDRNRINLYGGIEKPSLLQSKLNVDFYIIPNILIPPFINITTDITNQINTFFSNSKHSTTSINANQNNEIPPQTENLKGITANDANNFGLPTIQNFQKNTNGNIWNANVSTIPRLSSEKKAHHLSIMEVNASTGEKLRFGLPVYNKMKKEVSFNVSGNGKTPNILKNEVGYIPGADNSINNSNGENNYFELKQIPGWASEFLLTEIQFPDYVDVTNNGCTDDDLGTFLKFNYSLIHENFKWRAPFSRSDINPIANYNAGFNSKTTDQTASYEFGQKEVWYLQSIESKEHVAEFYVSDREDICSQLNENGGVDADKTLQKLDKIVIYNKTDRENNGTNATILKTIEFEYDYSVCPNLPSSISGTQGKLTLKKVFFTYGSSKKGTRSAYEFDYNTSANFGFNAAHINLWGGYKPIAESGIDNYFLPFVNQSDNLNDLYAAAWKLSEIKTPKGSTIEILYESDRYGYVEDEPAMQMFKVVSIENSPQEFDSELPKNDLYSNEGFKLEYIYKDVFTPFFAKGNNYLIIEFKQPITNDAEKQKELEKYLGNRTNFNIKTKVDLLGNGKKEIIEKLFKIDEIGVIGDTPPYNYGYVHLEDAGFHTFWSSTKNPIANEALSLLNHQLSELIYDNFPEADEINDINMAYIIAEFCSKTDLESTFISLFDPLKNKYGGGSRVSSILIHDNWRNMTGNKGNTYGRTYSYLNNEGHSSGVLNSEPFAAWQESPKSEALNYIYRIDNDEPIYHQINKPLGAYYLPTGVVGYSKVTIKSIEFTNSKTSNVGQSILNFYTARDFPTNFQRTKIDIQKFDLDKTFHYDDKLFDEEDQTITLKEVSTVSQGFLINYNDMHGRLKSMEVYDGNKVLINGTYFGYQTNTNNVKKLNNNVKCLNSNGEFTDELLGVNMEIVNDVTKIVNRSNFYMDGKTESKIDFINKIKKRSSAYQENSSKEFLANVLVKNVFTPGILKEVTVVSGASSMKTSFLAFDGYTGLPVITSTNNEFEDPEYSISYPSYWAYEDLGHSYKFNNSEISFVDISGGTVSSSGIDTLFNVGDKVYSSGGNILWVADKSTNQIKLIDQSGGFPSNEFSITLTLIESSKKNRLIENCFEVKTLDNPMASTSVSISNVLEASAQSYNQDWEIDCNFGTYCPTQSGSSCEFHEEDINCEYPTDPIFTEEDYCDSNTNKFLNPFLQGMLGKWIPDKSYFYKTTREGPAITSTDNNLRLDGSFTQFVPFWGFDNSNDRIVPINNSAHPNYNSSDLFQNWVQIGQLQKINKNSLPVQIQDIDSTHNSYLYGYGHRTLNAPVAAISNAKINQVGFDGAEDYFTDYNNTDCIPYGHWNFKEGLDKNNRFVFLDTTTAHSGHNSIKIENWGVHTISKHYSECSAGSPQIGEEGYEVKECHCLPTFMPDSGNYWFSVWVKETHGNGSMEAIDNYENARIIINQTLNGSIEQTDTIYPSGPIIEGWQQASKKIKIFDLGLDGERCITFSLQNVGENNRFVNFDDMRFHPFTSRMVSVNYFKNTLRLHSVLDENNYATFYKYSPEGELVSIMKETPKGILTVSEQRNELVKD